MQKKKKRKKKERASVTITKELQLVQSATATLNFLSVPLDDHHLFSVTQKKNKNKNNKQTSSTPSILHRFSSSFFHTCDLIPCQKLVSETLRGLALQSEKNAKMVKSSFHNCYYSSQWVWQMGYLKNLYGH